MAKSAKALLVTLLVLVTCGIIRQMHPGILRSAEALETSTAQTSKPQQTQNQLRQLLLERRRILDAIAQDLKRSVEAGRLSMAAYVDAKTAALTAGLDLCEAKTDRVKIHTEIVKWRKESEAWTRRRYEHGQGGQVDLNQARVACIEAEIDLLREQLR